MYAGIMYFNNKHDRQAVHPMCYWRRCLFQFHVKCICNTVVYHNIRVFSYCRDDRINLGLNTHRFNMLSKHTTVRPTRAQWERKFIASTIAFLT